MQNTACLVKSMRILFVIPTLGTGGAERVATILANHFSIKHTVEFFVLEKSTVERYPISENVIIKELGVEVKRGNKIRAISNYIVYFLKQRRELCHEIKEYGPDVVISFLPKADFLVSSTLSGKFRWIPSERNDPMRRSFIERSILNFIYKKGNPLVCQTQKVADFYKSKKVSKTVVIRNPLILKEHNTSEEIVDEDYIIAVGRLDSQKNYEMLIKAFSIVKRKKQFKEKLYILGNGPDEKLLQNQINELKMSDEIFLLGRKNDVFSYLKRASAFVMSSDYEGLPNALLEAMAAGLPVICTDFFSGAARDFIDDSNGFIVPVGNIELMSEAIIKLLSCTAEERLQMGTISMKKVNSLNVENICAEWQRLLH